MAYIPPHLRNKGVAKRDEVDENIKQQENTNPDDDMQYTQEDIMKYFWPNETISEISTAGRFHGKTLHDSADRPGELAFLYLYHGANPQFSSDHVIYVKTGLNLLPGYDAKGNKMMSNAQITAKARPIAVFKQTFNAANKGGFYFHGWFQITDIAILRPHTQELVDMLKNKFTYTKNGKVFQKDRDEAHWNAALSMTWALVKLNKDPVALKNLGKPRIERGLTTVTPREQAPSKSVNEMLAEMRLEARRSTDDQEGGHSVDGK
jgi:hypothetical protein